MIFWLGTMPASQSASFRAEIKRGASVGEPK
jgi:hypothetical protein